MKFYYPNCAISHEKESSMQIILQFGADLAIQNSSCVVELCPEFSGFFYFLIIPYGLGEKNFQRKLENVCNL